MNFEASLCSRLYGIINIYAVDFMPHITRLLCVFFPAAMAGSHTHYTSHSLHVHRPTTRECEQIVSSQRLHTTFFFCYTCLSFSIILTGEFRVPVPCSSSYTTHPLLPLLGTSATATSGIGAMPFAHPPPTTAIDVHILFDFVS